MYVRDGMRCFLPGFLIIGWLLLPGPAAAGASDNVPFTEKDILSERCSLCHTAMRIYLQNQENIRAVLLRMQEKKPGWINEIESAHIARELAMILGDPGVLARREAIRKSISSGKTVFQDRTAGKAPKSCEDCHPGKSLQGIARNYPKYDASLGKVVILAEKIRTMLVERMGAEELARKNEVITDLEAYISSL